VRIFDSFHAEKRVALALQAKPDHGGGRNGLASVTAVGAVFSGQRLCCDDAPIHGISSAVAQSNVLRIVAS